ncbi:flavin reductase family protein [Streptomyces sp. NPDC049813]|uniref:flavin reductase family protein n=1 Tax=Streptomyces sp. NPDC049813 TaxID=3365597 RepID=UPI0037B28AC7
MDHSETGHETDPGAHTGTARDGGVAGDGGTARDGGVARDGGAAGDSGTAGDSAPAPGDPAEGASPDPPAAGFDAFTALVDSPVYVVTTAAGGERAGCLVGFAAQCSLAPARFAVWLSKANHTYRLARTAQTLAVHLLDRHGHALAERFGGHCGAREDKFAGLDWTEGPGGAPVLAGALAWFAGPVRGRFDGGDHVAFLVEPAHTWTSPTAEGPALSLRDALDITAGHPR